MIKKNKRKQLEQDVPELEELKKELRRELYKRRFRRVLRSTVDALIVVAAVSAIIATLVLFYAVGHWNSFMSALLYLEDQDRMPLQIIIRKMVIDSDLASMTTANSSTSSSSETLLSENKIKYAIVMISVLPMVVVYPFLQKYFVKGVMIGAVKG